MIAIDTNIISEADKPLPSRIVVEWLNTTDSSALYLPTPVISELSAGAEEFKRKTGSSRHIHALAATLERFGSNVIEFDLYAAVKFGEVFSRRNGMGRPISRLDAMIAAICLVHGATLATRNVRDFDGLGLKLVNPFEGKA